MSCPTCDHTMHGIGNVPAVGGEPVFWCPRCGTLEDHTNGITDVVAPKLVSWCREFKAQTAGRVPVPLVEVWHRLGICEAINVPANRGCTQKVAG